MSVLSGLTTLISPAVVGMISYVLSALALYTLAQRRGIPHGWMAWVPVLNVWVLGSLSDQYRYVSRGECRSKRKTLLILRILKTVFGLVVLGAGLVLTVGIMGVFLGEFTKEAVLRWVMGPSAGVLALGVPLLGITVAYLIIQYMALYDVFLSCDPQNAVLFLVLSIFVGVTKPFFLFACRGKDYGMPPRRPRQEEN